MLTKQFQTAEGLAMFYKDNSVSHDDLLVCSHQPWFLVFCFFFSSSSFPVLPFDECQMVSGFGFNFPS